MTAPTVSAVRFNPIMRIPFNFARTLFADILDVVSKPMQIGNKIIPPYHGQDRQNDEEPNSVEEAAKQFKLASASMVTLDNI